MSKTMKAHWNRSCRRSGGSRRMFLNVPDLTISDRIALVVARELELNPAASLEHCANAAMTQTGANVEQVAKVFEERFLQEHEAVAQKRCRVCGCTDTNCSQCVEKTGSPCYWIEADLCSACVVRRS